MSTGANLRSTHFFYTCTWCMSSLTEFKQEIDLVKRKIAKIHHLTFSFCFSPLKRFQFIHGETKPDEIKHSSVRSVVIYCSEKAVK